MPCDDRFGFDDHQRGSPIGRKVRQPSPEVAIGGVQLGASNRALEDSELVAQGENFQLQGGMAAETAPKAGVQSSENVQNQPDRGLREPQAEIVTISDSQVPRRQLSLKCHYRPVKRREIVGKPVKARIGPSPWLTRGFVRF